ncbi:hypothetical protein [Paenibacillus sp. FJAT-26967]|uniref:hypothetical protein n=1 Tax=Paenibacillus sp. FJAT-26967 TaxID=1729690 RepID=UPI000838E627|nr:hypothetical protein [Paenibacillus sp. FJAT-26967]
MSKKDRNLQESERMEIPSDETVIPAKMAAEQSKIEELWIYIGPDLPIGLTKYASYRGGKPTHIKDYLTSVPDLDALFVPIKDFSLMAIEAKRQGSYLNAAYTAVENRFAKGV